MRSVDELLDGRPLMPAPPAPAASWAPPAERPGRKVSFGRLPDNVVAQLEDWGAHAGGSATAVVVAMVRALADDRNAGVRARVLADANEYALERRSRKP